MQIKTNYLVASVFSFLLHASLILFLVGYFYVEKKIRPILNNPINVSLIFEQDLNVNTKKKDVAKLQTQPVAKKLKSKSLNIVLESNQLQEIQPAINITPEINKLIDEDKNIIKSEDIKVVDKFSTMIIKTIEDAWLKPKNIQSGLICDLRIEINKNGRILKVSLVKSSGNIRFDNSAIKAVQRVETFNFFNILDTKIYQSNFRNIILTFNPS